MLDAWAAIGMAPPGNPVADRAAQVGAGLSAGADFVDGMATDTVTDPLTYAGGIGLGVKGASLLGRLTSFFRKSDVADDLAPSSNQIDAFSRQLEEHGVNALNRSRRKIQRRLDEHQEKLSEYESSGGHTSSVEREIRNFKRELKAIDEVLESADD